MPRTPEGAREGHADSGPRADHRRRHLEEVHRLVERLGTGELASVVSSIPEAFVGHSGLDAAQVWLYTGPRDCPICLGETETPRRLHLVAGSGVGAGFQRPAHTLSLEEGFIGRLAATGEWGRTNRLAEDAASVGDRELSRFARRNGLVGAGSYPLVFRDGLLGLLMVYSRRPIDPEEFLHGGILAGHAVVAIRSAQLYSEVTRLQERLARQNEYLKDEIRDEGGFGEIIGRSPALQEVIRLVRQVAPTDTPVLLQGETGTGKELVARAIHERSSRAGHPLIKVNCGAIPAGVAESELFGHERGAFTGAVERRIGRFELAHEGTLFLDEVGELPPEIQTKLLRALQEGEIERVGGARPIRVDARLVAATHRVLEADVAAGRFRADLYYRLNVMPIRVPPLRERAEDIPLLVEHMLLRLSRSLGKPMRAVTPASMERLMRYPWPGNIRELKNLLERACVLADGEVVEVPEPLGPMATGPAGAPLPSGEDGGPTDRIDAEASPSGEERSGSSRRSGAAGPPLTLEEVERAHIARVLQLTRGRIAGPRGAAILLGLHPNTLRSRMEKLGMRVR